MRIIYIPLFEKFLDLILGKRVYFYDPRIHPGWGEGDYVVNILSCRPGRCSRHQYEAYLGGRDRETLLLRARVWVESANENR